MSKEFELRDQLKSQALGNVNPSAFKFVGSTVFPDRAAKFDLNDFVEVVNAYRATHLPTYGQIIPSSTEITTVSVATSENEKTLIDLTGADDTNTVLEVVAISTPFPGDYEMTSGLLAINNGGLTNVAIYDIVKIDIITNKTAGILYGDGIDYNDAPVSPQPIFVNGGEKLILQTRDAPNATLSLNILTRKRSQ